MRKVAAAATRHLAPLVLGTSWEHLTIAWGAKNLGRAGIKPRERYRRYIWRRRYTHKCQLWDRG